MSGRDTLETSMLPVTAGGQDGLAVQVQKVKKSYGGIHALKGVDLAIKTGEIYGIIGSNGAGKSTMFDVMCGIVPPTSGQVALFGRSIAGLRPDQVAHMGVARTFQRTAVFPHATVMENLRFAFHQQCRHSVWGRLVHSKTWKLDEDALSTKAKQIAQITGLWEDRDRSASILAYGVQRRLAVAIALMSDPKLLFLDEPAAGMDDNDSEDFVHLIKQVAEGRTVVIVEHDMAVITALCHRCLAMVDGMPVVEGMPGEVLRHPKVVQAYLGGDDE